MNRLLFIAAFLLLVPLAVTAQDPGCTVQDLDWIVGDWQGEEGTTIFTESWEHGPQDTLLGKAGSRSTDGTEVYVQESLLLESRDGGVFYVVNLNKGNSPVAFRVISCDEDSFKVENREHDFPNYIEYKRKGADSYMAHITDLTNKGFDLDFQRAEAK